MSQTKSSFSERRKGFVALIVLSFVFASMGIFARFLKNDFTLFQQTYLRIFLAFIIAVIIFSKSIRFSRYLSLPKKDLLLLFFRAITLYGGILLISEAFFTAKYGNVSFIAAFPVLAVLGYLFFKEKFSFSKLSCIFLALVGLVLIGIRDFSNVLNFGYGELLALLSAFLFAFSYVGRKWQSNYLTNKEMTVAIFLIGSTLLFLSSVFVLGEPFPSTSTFAGLTLLILFIAALFNVANLVLTNYCFERVESGVAGNVLTLETFFSVVYGIILFSEIPTVKEIFGGIIIVISVIWLNQIESKN